MSRLAISLVLAVALMGVPADAAPKKSHIGITKKQQQPAMMLRIIEIKYPATEKDMSVPTYQHDLRYPFELLLYQVREA